jgi:hypothetical protein
MRAVVNGVKIVRPCKMNKGLRSAIQLLREKGMVIKQIARKLKVGVGTALDLPTWIENKGGVQEIKLGHSATYVSPKAKAQIGKQYFDGKATIGNAKSELLSQVADAEFMGSPCVLLAEQMADGSFDIKAVVRSTSVVNAAYVALYGHQNKVMEAAKNEVEAANDADGSLAKVA